MPQFPYQQGWLGGDAAYSVALGDGRTLWLFGDSFVGTPGQENRQNSDFIHNSIAISRCDHSGFDIDYRWGPSKDAKAQAFLQREGEGWWWLFDGFVHEGSLYLGLLEVEKGKETGELSLPFRFTGMQLARIDNPHSPPEQWRAERINLSGSSRVLPARAMVVADDYLWLFTFIDQGNGNFPGGLARIPLSAFDDGSRDLSDALETFTHDGSFQPGIEPANLEIVMEDNATEMSVDFHPEIGRWLAVYNYPDAKDFPRTRPSDAILLRSAEELTGPWSKPRVVHHIAELAPEARADPNTGCYAAKEHPQFDTGALIVTYVCNLFTGPGEDAMTILERLLVDMRVYRPIPVRIELPAELTR